MMEGNLEVHSVTTTTTTTELFCETPNFSIYRIHHRKRIETAVTKISAPAQKKQRVRTRVRLFCLQDTLWPEAEELREILIKPPTRSDIALFSQIHSRSINPSYVELLTFDDFNTLMDQHSYYESADVVVILGHSNVYSFGPLAISDILGALLRLNRPPSFVAFLGCCGGNPRYGPLKMLSLLPEWQETIFSFFQRRIYKDELYNTVPVVAIQYYLHLVIHFAELDVPLPEIMVCSIAIRCAYSDRRCRYKCDSARFIKPIPELSPAQELLSEIKDSVPGANTTRKIPLSCWQLLIYHTFTADEYKEQNIREFVTSTKTELQLISKTMTNAEIKNKIDEMCIEELKHQRLCKIIELACKIKRLEVTEKTFELLRSNKWKKVDHLQFFVAMLQGYWGKNDYYYMRALAMFHFKLTFLNLILNSITAEPSEQYLHYYHLCCVGFCLFSPEAYITFPENHSHLPEKYGFYVQVQYSAICLPVSECCIRALPTNEDEVLWADLHTLCWKDERFIKLYALNNPTLNDFISIHSHSQDECTCKGGSKCECLYNYHDLDRALKALHYKFFRHDSCPNYEYFYEIGCFQNRGDDSTGYMASFPPSFQMQSDEAVEQEADFQIPQEVIYTEMRVICDPDKLVGNQNPNTLKVIKNPTSVQVKTIKRDRKNYETKWNKVSRCRFVFECNKIGETKQGKLFFTDSHYGDDKIFKINAKVAKRDKYTLLKKELENLHKKLLENLLNELNCKIDYELNNKKLKTLLSTSNFRKVQKISLTEELKASVSDLENTLATQKLQELLNNWLVKNLDQIFCDKVRRLAMHADWPKKLTTTLENKLVRIVEDSIREVKHKMTSEGVYPFVEIGVLTLTKDREPRLTKEWPYI